MDYNDEIMSYRGASEYLDIKVSTLYSLVHHNRIPHIRLTARLVRFSKKALDQWLDEGSSENIEGAWQC